MLLRCLNEWQADGNDVMAAACMLNDSPFVKVQAATEKMSTLEFLAEQMALGCR